MDAFEIAAQITKLNEEQQIVYGWASVVTEKGEPVVDSQGDIIDIQDLSKAVHDFMAVSRQGKLMHVGKRVGEIVESLVFTSELQKAMGIDLQKEGWFVGYKVHDPEVWKAVKSGKYKAFSIGGFGEREKA